MLFSQQEFTSLCLSLNDISCDIIHVSCSVYMCMMASNPLLINKDILTISPDSKCLCPFCHSKFITPNMMCWFSQKTSQLSPGSKFVFGEANTSGWNRNTGTLCFSPTSVNAFKFFLKKEDHFVIKLLFTGLDGNGDKVELQNEKKSKKVKVDVKSVFGMRGWLESWFPDQAIWLWALAREIVLCSEARNFPLTIPISTQVYKWVLANCWGNLVWGSDLWWTSLHLVQEEYNYS